MKYKIDCSFCDREWVESDSVLAALADNRIFSVTRIDPNDDPDNAGKFRVAEMCDNYFCGCLTAEQLRALGHELIAIADSSNASVGDGGTPHPKRGVGQEVQP